MSTMSTKPDIVFLILDTQRADRLSCYGYPRGTSPHIDEFAESATLFERAVVPAQWTIPSHASIFTGEYPTTHMTTQIYDTLSEDQVTLAELLRQNGYETVGFCNNPLLGVVQNELDRGFEAFYNYGGAVPNPPDISKSRPKLLGRLFETYVRLMRRIVAPIQNQFAHNNLLLRIALNPVLAAIWQRRANFKGKTARSLRDVVGFLRIRRDGGPRRPLFTFINLMETHLPFWPPARFVNQFAPYYQKERESRDFMRHYNIQHYSWMVPLTQPLNEIADRTLNDFYDAEVAYQDHLLRHLFRYLNQPEVRDNTMVIITSDHGEGMNNHNFVGHSLVAYDDLVRVPLIIRYPAMYPAGKRVSTLVSTRRLFHSALEAANIMPNGNGKNGDKGAPVGVEELSLARSIDGPDPERETVFAEAYTPDTLLALMESQDPAAIDTFRCRSMRRAVYRGRHKMIAVGQDPDELFDVIDDPDETHNLLDEHPGEVAQLQNILNTFVEQAEERRPDNWEQARQVSLEDDEALARRLRALGYIE
jgi:arylsulfatase A-like enzyme